jgi:hypothetical protein
VNDRVSGVKSKVSAVVKPEFAPVRPVQAQANAHPTTPAGWPSTGSPTPSGSPPQIKSVEIHMTSVYQSLQGTNLGLSEIEFFTQK